MNDCASLDAPRSTLRVLVFIGEPAACVKAQEALARAGFNVDATANSTSLYQVIQGEAPPYDVLVADCGRRDLPAEGFARHMRTRLPEVALALAAPDVDLRRTPCDAWIRTPCPPDALVDVVRAAARAARERRRRQTHGG